jgi:hypothetical protein
MRRTFGLSIAVIVALDGCVDDPTFQQADASAPPDGAGSTNGSSSSSGGPTPSDAGPGGRCNPATCAGTCDADTCVIACPGRASCDDEIRCPAGADCRITCSGKAACKKVTCSGGATSCSLTCDGDQACSDEIDLNAPSSTMVCTGKDACRKVACEGAACAVQCDGASCAPKDVRCCAETCLVNGVKGECK